MSSRTRPAALATSTSVSPSLSTSPNAAPRLTSDSSKTAPARSVAASKPVPPRLRNTWLRWSSVNGLPGPKVSKFRTTAPFAAITSSQPSLSMSIHAAPKPVYGRLGARMPSAALRSRNRPAPSFT